jgi:hypothetical protein
MVKLPEEKPPHDDPTEAVEDLEVEDQQADSVQGGVRKAGGGQVE